MLFKVYRDLEQHDERYFQLQGGCPGPKSLLLP